MRPGTELKLILLSLRIRAKKVCNCEETLAWMDRLGVEGCKRDRHLLIPRLRENASQFGVSDWMIAGLSACANGLILSLNPLDPIPGLFDEAIRRSEEKLRTHESYGV